MNIKTINMTTITRTLRMVEVKAYSIGELASLYEISVRTMNRWLKPHLEKIGKRQGRFFTVKQVETIFDLLGLPKEYD